MNGFSENIKSINSFAKTGLSAILVTLFALISYFTYTTVFQPLLEDRHALKTTQNQLKSTQLELEQSQKQFRAATVKIEKLETAMRLLKIDHRLAQIKVLSITKDPLTQSIKTQVKMQEMDSSGNSIGEATIFEIAGHNIYVDFWLVKFEDRYIEQNDLLRSTTLCMFKSIYGENQAPSEATPIEKPWVRPKAYGGNSKINEFEQQIWDDFWTIANDSSKSKELGIRASHGQAVYLKAEVGKTYLIELRASDGLSFKPFTGLPPGPRT